MALINFPTDFSSLSFILIVSSVIIYRASFLHNRKIFRLSLLQILYLIILPGVFLIILSSYVQSITSRPLVNDPIFSDRVFTDVIYLTFFFTYGGIAIHAVTKMLSETLRNDNSEAAQLNQYFHLNFSHNLIFSGMLMAFTNLALLELNHQPSLEPYSLVNLTIRGIVLGLGLILSMFHYTRSKDQYVGRWADLKATFITLWILIIMTLYFVRQIDPTLRQYDNILPIFLVLSLGAILNIALIVRKIRRTFNHRSQSRTHNI